MYRAKAVACSFAPFLDIFVRPRPESSSLKSSRGGRSSEIRGEKGRGIDTIRDARRDVKNMSTANMQGQF